MEKGEIFMNKYNKISDIVVIGSGVAGLSAALSAKKLGVNVTVMNSGKAASMRASGFNYINSQNDSIAGFFSDILKSGEFINNPILVAELSAFASDIQKHLISYGINIEDAGKIKVRLSGGNSIPRTVYTEGEHLGAWLIEQLDIKARENEIKFVDCNVFDIEHKDEIFIIHGFSGENEITCYSKAVIIATGGLGRLYRYTTNYSSSNGMGYMIALNLGAALIDMEFTQFEPFIMMGPGPCRGRGIPINLVADGGKIINSKGEEFIPPSPLGIRAYTKDVLGKIISNEILEGRGSDNGGVFCDLSEAGHLINKYPGFVKTCQLANIDPLKYRFEICPAYHCMMGGIMIDANANTGVKGLYAAGEVAGGVHGANRIGSNGITDAICFGTIAGQNAATYVMEIQEIDYYKLSCATDKKSFNFQLPSLEEFYDILGKTMIENVGLVRSEANLIKAIDTIKTIRNKLNAVTYYHNLYKHPRHIELINTLNLAEIITKAAIKREETRGVHYRKDFPCKNSKYDGNFVIRKHNGTFEYGFLNRRQEITWE